MVTRRVPQPSVTSAAPLLKPDPIAPPYAGQTGGSDIGPVAVPERKKLISSGFSLRSTLYGPRPGYQAIGSMRGGAGDAGAEHRLRIRDGIASGSGGVEVAILLAPTPQRLRGLAGVRVLRWLRSYGARVGLWPVVQCPRAAWAKWPRSPVVCDHRAKI